MSSRINVGKVCPIPKGNWTSTTTYEKLNMVNNGGVLYIAKDNVEANTAIDNINKWMQATGKTLVGNVETVSYTTNASVTTTTSVDGNTILNFRLPRGMSGNDDLDDTAGSGDTDKVWSADKTFSEIDNIKNDKASVITETASGAIASFPDGSPAPVTALNVGIEPVQDLHGYSNPWPAGGNVNLLPSGSVADVTQDGIRFRCDGNGKYTFSGTNTSSDTVNFNVNITSITLPSSTIYVHMHNDYSTNYLSLWFMNNSTSVAGLTWSSTDRISSLANLSSATVNKIRFSFPANYEITGTINCQLSFELTSSVTSWTPYENICPISGWTEANVTRTGKNLLPESTVSIGNPNPRTYSIKFDSTPLPVGTYSITYTKDYQVGNLQVVYTDGSSLTIGSNNTFTATKPFNRIFFYMNQADYNNGKVITFSNIQLELGSTATAYEPYQGTSVTISLGDTRYGGTIDVLAGTMVVDRAYVDMGTLTWSDAITNVAYGITYHRVTELKTIIKKPVNSSSILDGLICSAYKTNVSANIAYGGGSTYCVPVDADGNLYVYDPDHTTETGTQFATLMSGIQLVYPLAQPVTVTLSPSTLSTLLGQNNIWSDTGNIQSLTYRADTKLYIQKLTQPKEDDMTANSNIAANTFFMVGNTLYYSTQAISTGTTIVPGSNCTQLSLADALNQLNA